MMLLRTFLLFCALLAAPAAQAHRPSDAFLDISMQGDRLQGQWQVALRDLAAVLPLDANADGTLTWGELRAQEPALRELLLQALSVSTPQAPCTLAFEELLVNARLDGPYAWIAFTGQCPQPAVKLAVDYRFLFELDPTHRGIAVLRAGSATHTGVFDPQHTRIEFSTAQASPWSAIADYVREGVHHIWIGVDHILFLVSLLLPCVLLRTGGAWQPRASFQPVLWDVVGVVTAFTVAHSITLTLAALDILRLPGALVESVIALSVVLAALNNLWPVVTGQRWMLAFGFGLLHGFGFASVLGELGLPEGLRLLALFSFNLGVELGQLAIVALLLPLAYALRGTRFYRQGLLGGGSLLVALLALAWFAERSGLQALLAGG